MGGATGPRPPVGWGGGGALVLFGLSGHTVFDEDNNELIRFVKTTVFVFSHV